VAEYVIPHRFQNLEVATTVNDMDLKETKADELSKKESDEKRKTRDTETVAQQGSSQYLQKLMLAAPLTPPPTRQQTPASPTIRLFDTPISSSPSSTSVWKSLPRWAVVSLQIMITMPLYIFSFWLMIEAIKAGGDTLIDAIDYLAFRP
jgi:hypothetical protein